MTKYLRISSSSNWSCVRDNKDFFADFGEPSDRWKDYIVSDDDTLAEYVKPKPRNGWYDTLSSSRMFYKDDVMVATVSNIGYNAGFPVRIYDIFDSDAPVFYAPSHAYGEALVERLFND